MLWVSQSMQVCTADLNSYVILLVYLLCCSFLYYYISFIHRGMIHRLIITPLPILSTLPTLSVSFSGGNKVMNVLPYNWSPENGGHPVAIIGEGFHNSSMLRCHFGVAVSHAVFVSIQEVRCVVPAYSPLDRHLPYNTYRTWSITITRVDIMEAAGVTVTQGINTGILSVALENKWTIGISTSDITAGAGVTVTQAGYMTWTVIIQSQGITKAAGATVSQATGTGATCTDPDFGTTCNAHNADSATCITKARTDAAGATCVFAAAIAATCTDPNAGTTCNSHNADSATCVAQQDTNGATCVFAAAAAATCTDPDTGTTCNAHNTNSAACITKPRQDAAGTTCVFAAATSGPTGTLTK